MSLFIQFFLFIDNSVAMTTIFVYNLHPVRRRAVHANFEKNEISTRLNVDEIADLMMNLGLPSISVDVCEKIVIVDQLLMIPVDKSELYLN